jgi:hypothetical protein
VWAVALGSVDVHPAGEVHAFGETAAASRSQYSASAVHPRQPVHFETSDTAQRPVCPVCLLRLQTAGVRLVQGAGFEPPAEQGTLPVSLPLALADLSCQPFGARAPPLA